MSTTKGNDFGLLKTFLTTIFISCFLFACASKKSEQSAMVINPGLIKQSPEDLAFWMVFALGQSSCGKKFPTYSFGEFSCAFGLASLIGEGKKDKTSKPKSQFQQDLGKIREAGFLQEYMFHQYRQSQWFILPDLQSEAYFQWVKSNLPNHIPGDPNSVTMEQPQEEIPDTSKRVQLSDQFLKSTGFLQFEESHQLEKNSLGIRLRYSLTNQSGGWLDFYIYPNSRFSDDSSLVNILVDEASSAKAGIIYYAQEYKAEKMETIEESFSDDKKFLSGVYLITANNSVMASELYISGNKDYIVKARATFPFERKSFYVSEIKNIFQSLLDNVE